MSIEVEADSPRFANAAQVAEILGLSRSHINRLRVYNPEQSPPFIRVGDRVLYPLSGPNGLGAWAAQRAEGGAR